MNNLFAYILTLKHDADPVLGELVQELDKLGFASRIVKGVRGADLWAGEYFNLMAQAQKTHGYQLSPGEIGCALGHKKIYAEIMASGAQMALVFEDDVDLRAFAAHASAVVHAMMTSTPDFLHLGGMDGLACKRDIFGRRLEGEWGIYEIEPESLPDLHRMYGYALSARLASDLYAELERCIFRIDDYTVVGSLIPNCSIFYWPIVGHPVDLSKSEIEEEREMLRRTRSPRPLIQRIAGELAETYRNRRKKFALKAARRRKGFVRVHDAD